MNPGGLNCRKRFFHFGNIHHNFVEDIRRNMWIPSYLRARRETDMATGSSTLLEEQCQCPICLDLYSDPATTPCGHSFCKACLEGYWSGLLTPICPLCKAGYVFRPKLQVNYVLRDVVENFKQLTRAEAGEQEDGEQEAETVQRPSSESGDGVVCDMCLGVRRKAVKSCLVCLMSYCMGHLRCHGTSFTKHRLVEPAANLQDRMCRKHQRPLELFCRKDRTYLCLTCTDHQGPGHEVVSMRSEYMIQKVMLRKSFENMTRQLGVASKAASGYNSSVRRGKDRLEREVHQVESLCRDLIGSVEQVRERFMTEARSKMTAAETASSLQSQELSDYAAALRTRREELVPLIGSTDPFHFLQALPPVSAAAPERPLVLEFPSDLLAKPLDAFREDLLKALRTQRSKAFM